MLGEWYLPPGECQVISTITEGTISISHSACLSSQTRISKTPPLQADNFYDPSNHPAPRSGGLMLGRALAAPVAPGKPEKLNREVISDLFPTRRSRNQRGSERAGVQLLRKLRRS